MSFDEDKTIELNKQNDALQIEIANLEGQLEAKILNASLTARRVELWRELGLGRSARINDSARQEAPAKRQSYNDWDND